MRLAMNSAKDDVRSLLKYLVIYQSRKTKNAAVRFEKFKNISVEVMMHRRGKFQKHIWHFSMVGLATVGVMTSGATGGDSLISSAFPGVGGEDPRIIETFDPNANGISLESLVDFKTSISQKPRSEILEYEVQPGDTLSQVA